MSRFLAFGLSLTLAAPAAVEGVAALEERPGLYELTARSDLVVSARVVSGSLKLALVEVGEVFRGAARPGQRIQIAFRDFNLNLGKDDRIVFHDGERIILFLVPELDWEGNRKGEDRYTLHRGRFGKFSLPREGEGIYRDAVRQFARLASLRDHRMLYSELKALLNGGNPVLVDAGLQEVGRLRLMDRDLVPEVMPFLQDPSPLRRTHALLLLAGFFEALGERPRSLELQDATLPPVATLARNDPAEEVRVAAVEALGAWGGEAVESTLKEIAEQDPAQAVRYRARVILLREVEGKKEESSKPGKTP